MTTALARADSLLTDNPHLVGGDWVPAASGQTIEVVDPATSEVLRTVPRGSAEDVDAAVSAATGAFPAWRDTSPSRRAALLFAWARLIEEYEQELDQLESQEVGRPHWGPPPMSRQLTFVAGQADKVQGLSPPGHTPDVLGLTLPHHGRGLRAQLHPGEGGVDPWHSLTARACES
jgi:aldehyde dehydrogenase (NAD+)